MTRAVLVLALFHLVLALGEASCACASSSRTDVLLEDHGLDGGSDSGILIDSGRLDAGSPSDASTVDSGRSDAATFLERCDHAPCSDGGVCHPVFKVCVLGCLGGCPSFLRRCADQNGQTVSRDSGYCQCLTDQVCGAGVPGSICSSLIRVCTQPCSVEACPAGYACDQSGQCTVADSGP